MAKQFRRIPLPGIKQIVLVSSAKGGVGKSTLAVSLAFGLKHRDPGSKVGLLDADVFGPSIPRMMNLEGRPELNKQNLMIPLVNYGIKCMSMGFLMNQDDAVVWRGLMVMSAIEKLLRGVAWGSLDYLIIDMPPGTGDTQLSITQGIPVSGAVVVTTPQEVALQDARRGISMFRKVNLNVIGIVGNMSVFICDKCKHPNHIFGNNGAEELAQESKLPFLGNVPLDKALRESCDSGQPLVVVNPESSSCRSIFSIVENLVKYLPPALTT